MKEMSEYGRPRLDDRPQRGEAEAARQRADHHVGLLDQSRDRGRIGEVGLDRRQPHAGCELPARLARARDSALRSATVTRQPRTDGEIHGEDRPDHSRAKHHRLGHARAPDGTKEDDEESAQLALRSSVE